MEGQSGQGLPVSHTRKPRAADFTPEEWAKMKEDEKAEKKAKNKREQREALERYRKEKKAIEERLRENPDAFKVQNIDWEQKRQERRYVHEEITPIRQEHNKTLGSWMDDYRYDFVIWDRDWINGFNKNQYGSFLILYIRQLRNMHKLRYNGHRELTDDANKHPRIRVITNHTEYDPYNVPYRSIVNAQNMRTVYRRTRFDHPDLSGKTRSYGEALSDILAEGFSRVFWQKDWEEMTEAQRNTIILTQDELNEFDRAQANIPVVILIQDPRTRELYEQLNSLRYNTTAVDTILNEFLLPSNDDTSSSSNISNMDF